MTAKTGKFTNGDHSQDELLNDIEFRFVEAWVGDAVQAAKLAGCKEPQKDAQLLMKNPTVRRALLVKQDWRLARIIESSTRRFSDISLDELTAELLHLAYLPPVITNGNIDGQVRALEAVAILKVLRLQVESDQQRNKRGSNSSTEYVM